MHNLAPGGRALVAAAGVFALAVASCGGGTPAKGADDEAKHASDEPPPKWDTSSESAENAHKPKFRSNTSPGSEDVHAPSAAPPAPHSAPPKEHREGEYDKEAVEMELAKAARRVKDNCGAAKDENGKAPGPWGKVVITVQVGHNGHTKGASVPPPYDGTPAARCIAQAFTRLAYPPWRGADANVDWEVELVQPK